MGLRTLHLPSRTGYAKIMNTTMTLSPNLFGESDPIPDAELAPEATLFAEIVFDRPLDHAYSYAVPTELEASISVGKAWKRRLGKVIAPCRFLRSSHFQSPGPQSEIDPAGSRR